MKVLDNISKFELIANSIFLVISPYLFLPNDFRDVVVTVADLELH